MRCGRCKEVFDANVNMLLSGNAPQLKRTAPAPAPMQPLPAPEADAPGSAAGPTASSSPEPAAAPERPQVWGRARAPSQEHAADDSPQVATSAPAPLVPDTFAVPQSAVPIQQPAPWTGYFAPPAPSVRLPESLTQNISYGLRREANVVPPGWSPDMDGSPVDGHTSAHASHHVATPFVAAPSAPFSPLPLGGTDAERVEPGFVDKDLSHAPTAGGKPVAEPVTPPSTTSRDPDPEPEDAEDSELPELTFEASRQHLFMDEPTLRELHLHPDDLGRHEPALASEAHESTHGHEGDVASAEGSGTADHLPPDPVHDATTDVATTDVSTDVASGADAPSQEAAQKQSEDAANVATAVRDTNDADKPTVSQESAAEARSDATDAEPQPEPQLAHAPDMSVDADADADPNADDHAHDVGFIRAARRKAFWSRPVVRGVLVLSGLALCALLAAQYAVAERNRLAATYPALRPVIEQLCMPLGCEIGAPRQIAAISIDSSTFTRTRDDADTFQLLVTLKSSAPTVLEMPALELTLTDAQNQPVLRRVLTRADTAAPSELPATGEWSGAVRLHVPEVAQHVVGYRLLAFYP